MILVPTRVAPSGIHGNGLFAVAPIARGTPIYRLLRGFDQLYTRQQWAALPEPARSFTRHFSYLTWDSGELVLSGDHARFMNHAEAPNTGVPLGSADVLTTVALRDIAASEELTCDYRAFDADVAWKLGRVPDHAPLGAVANAA
jgi:uncharacterized protein